MPHPPSASPGLPRRIVLGRAAAASLAVPALTTPVRAQTLDTNTDAAAWAAFKDRFLTADGRVIDTGNADVSHTEGQGWGMYLAATFDDREAFDRIHNWTRRTLARPNDALHIWRYRPGTPNPTDDPNNATDGDIFIAAALAMAGRKWRQPDLTQRARTIAAAILSLLVRQIGPATLLAPGVDGFTRPEGLIVNPSYYAFTQLDALAKLKPDPAWAKLRKDGIALIDKARFGEWKLPPDWVLVTPDGTTSPAPGQKPQYGYDAIRVPLYLAWAGIDSPVLPAIATWWRHATPPPAWVDVTTGATAEYPAGPGMQAATLLAINDPQPVSPIDAGMDYYTAALCMLTRVAMQDITARRTAANRR